MIRRLFLMGAPLAVAALLAAPAASQAQRFGVGFGGRSGGVYLGTGPAYNYGYGGYGGWAGQYPGYSYGRGGYSYPGYGYPSYSYSYPGTYYSTPSYYNSGTTITVAPATGGYQSFYPSDPSTRDSRTAYVRVQVPADAEVWFEGQKTQQRGSDRLFVSPPLKADTNYTYDIRARWMDNGREVEQTRTVHVRAGTEKEVNFLAADNNRTYRDNATQEAPPATGTPLPAERRDIANPNRPATPQTETPTAPSGIDNRRGPQNPADVNTPPSGNPRPGADINPNRPLNPQTETPTAPPGTNNGGVNRPGGPGSSSSPASRP